MRMRALKLSAVLIAGIVFALVSPSSRSQADNNATLDAQRSQRSRSTDSPVGLNPRSNDESAIE